MNDGQQLITTQDREHDLRTGASDRLLAASALSEKGGALYLIILFLAVVSVLVLLLFFVFGTVVPPNMIGVRRNYFSIPPILKAGLSERGLAPGLHFQVPGITTVFTVPRDFLIINLNEGQEGGDLDKGELTVPTTDGSKVKTDVALLFRLYEEPKEAPVRPEGDKETAAGVPLTEKKSRAHGGPAELITTYGLATESQLQTLARISENELTKSLSSLSTSDYYDPALREKAALRALEAINQAVAPKGVEVWSALVRRYVYADERIDTQIFEKNLEDQTRRLNASAGALSAAQAETARTRALWDARIRDLEVEGEGKSKILQSEGDLYEARKRAEGDLLVAKARADVDAAKAKILSEVTGAEVYVAREMTPFLNSLTGGIVTDLDPFDISKWVERLTGVKGEQR